MCIYLPHTHVCLVPVNGQTESEAQPRQQKGEELPFIVIAASENDSANEPFIPTDDSKPNEPGFNLLPRDHS